VTTVTQAVQAVASGADVIVAQGGEAGGYSGEVSTLSLVPQVVDAVAPIPVVAAGGIFDGRGLAAALMLGAAGVNLGTRFLASNESQIEPDWLEAILKANSEDAVKAEVLNDIMPLPGRAGYGTVLRALPTPFLKDWSGRREQAASEAGRLLGEMAAGTARGERGCFLATAGQTAGAIRDVLPVAEIIQRLVAEAEQALARGAGL
ncbi:MAG: nitronate monooxygenase, partial [Chloroflexota bacterium]